MNSPALSRYTPSHPPSFRGISPPLFMAAQVVLGSPGFSCRGVGICRVIAADRPSGPFSCTCGALNALIEKVSEASLLFRFVRKDIPPAWLDYHFVASGFELQQDFSIPLCMRQALALGPSFIPKGRYNIRQTPEHLLVIFSLLVRPSSPG